MAAKPPSVKPRDPQLMIPVAKDGLGRAVDPS
jgi:hypothetical protein